MKYIQILIIVLTILSIIQASSLIPNACLEFSSRQCIKCKSQTHLFEGKCFSNILGCTSYSSGNLCLGCEKGVYNLENGRCKKIGGEPTAEEIKASLYKYTGGNLDDPGKSYGQGNFNPTTYDNVRSWPSFIGVDKFVREGEYSHFISRMINPLYSVHYYTKNQTYSYKLLYHGSGGGLFLCIADIDENMKVNLRSLTPISASNVISNCNDYDLGGKCLQCKDTDHLEKGQCYQNYGGCIKYFQNMCLECTEYSLLVENRCVSDCVSISDARSLLYYHSNLTRSSIEIYYQVSISIFYSNLNSWISSSSSSTSSSMSSSTSSSTSTSTINTITNTTTTFNANGGSSSTSPVPNTVSSSQNYGIIDLAPNANFNRTFSSSYQIIQSQPVITTTSNQYLSNLIQQSSLQSNQSSSPADLTDILSKLLSTSSSSYSSQLSAQNACLLFKSDKTCVKCIDYYFVNEMNICEKVSSYCTSFDPLSQKCIGCLNGYLLINSRCTLKN